MDRLPIELLALIFSHLPPLSVWSLRAVCKQWAHQLTADALVNQALSLVKVSPTAGGWEAFRAHYTGIPGAYRQVGKLSDSVGIRTEDWNKWQASLHGSIFVARQRKGLDLVKARLFDLASGEQIDLMEGLKGPFYDMRVTERIVVLTIRDEMIVFDVQTRTRSRVALPSNPGWNPLQPPLSSHGTRIAIGNQTCVWIYDHADKSMSKVSIPVKLQEVKILASWPYCLHLGAKMITIFTVHSLREQSVKIRRRSYTMAGDLIMDTASELQLPPMSDRELGLISLIPSDDPVIAQLHVEYDQPLQYEPSSSQTQDICYNIETNMVSSIVGEESTIRFWRDTAVEVDRRQIQFFRLAKDEWVCCNILEIPDMDDTPLLCVNDRFLVIMSGSKTDHPIHCFAFGSSDQISPMSPNLAWTSQPFRFFRMYTQARHTRHVMTEAAKQVWVGHEQVMTSHDAGIRQIQDTSLRGLSHDLFIEYYGSGSR